MADRQDEVLTLYRAFADGAVSRREFMRRSTTLGIAGAATAALGVLTTRPGEGAVRQLAKAAALQAPVNLAEWSYFWLGVTRAKLARGTVANGEQMYVEYWVPAQVRHPYPMVIVHGGGGQGLDWLGRPDGGPGWVSYLLQEGYAVYLVDRPGHGRSPFHPELHGAFPPRAATYANLERQFTAPGKVAMPYGPEAKLHTQWVGEGTMGDPTVDQVIAGQGGSFLPDLAATHALWAQRGGELLDKIGPAIIMAHSMGGPSGWIYANARPNLVKGIVGIEPNGPQFGNLRWGVTASPMVYDPPVSDPADLKTIDVKATEPNRVDYKLLAQPRRLKNLQGIPIAIVTAPASYHWPYDYATVAFLRQCGCTVEHIELEKRGITGNAHFMMMERNNREVLQPVLDFLQKHETEAERRAAPRRARAASGALSLADHGFFWVGVERKKMPYGVIASGQMYVQYLVPAQPRRRTPIVLVHAASGQMLQYMGGGEGAAGWAHDLVRAGYTVYLVDLPGHGRAVYHPDALGPIGPVPTYEQLRVNLTNARAADQFMAGQNAMPQDAAMHVDLSVKAGAELLDKVGPAVLVTQGGPYGPRLVETRRQLVRDHIDLSEGIGGFDAVRARIEAATV